MAVRYDDVPDDDAKLVLLDVIGATARVLADKAQVARTVSKLLSDVTADSADWVFAKIAT